MAAIPDPWRPLDASRFPEREGWSWSRLDLAPPPRTDPRLLEPVRVRVLKSFRVSGKVVEIDNIIELARYDAESMAAIHRCEIL